MAIQYDPKILQQFADELYEQAKRIVLATAAWYALVTFIVAWSFFSLGGKPAYGGTEPSEALLLAGIISLFALGGGIQAGKRKALALKLQAQQILGLREIELNTRKQEQRAGTGS